VDRRSELMDQMSHASMCIAIFVGSVFLSEAIDKDGSQRLVLAVVGRGIGVQEEMSATGGVHGCTLECELIFVDSSPRKSYQTDSPKPSWRALRV
jgi:hypothetical protein